MTAQPTVQILPYITVEAVAPALELAFEWADRDPERGTSMNLTAFVDMVRALDRYQEANRDA